MTTPPRLLGVRSHIGRLLAMTPVPFSIARRTAPPRFGVYMFRAPDGAALYVGESGGGPRGLRGRIGQHVPAKRETREKFRRGGRPKGGACELAVRIACEELGIAKADWSSLLFRDTLDRAFESVEETEIQWVEVSEARCRQAVEKCAIHVVDPRHNRP